MVVMNNSRQESFLMVMVQFSFNSQPPTKGTAIDNISLTPSIVMVSILSPQQRGLQYGEIGVIIDTREVSILSPQQRGLQSLLTSQLDIS